MKIEDNIADKILQKSENSQYPCNSLTLNCFIAISESLDENSKNLNNLEIIRKKCENVENENELKDEIDKKSIV
ncbi:hypothetical protein A3Q56_07275 [Intoshia linei]|uniref:Uncharacterized protein n=1 Tax=Intoshia linei TaxID=1819745 RepID=A0A177ASJ4_9BILA|nr:hypothetical protein A3Q56_07275 [Intoshia linei]